MLWCKYKYVYIVKDGKVDVKAWKLVGCIRLVNM